MARIALTSDDVRVTFSRAEKVFGTLRDVTVPFANVRSVKVVADALGAVRGLRAPGTAVPRRLKLGRYRSKGTWSLVAVRRGIPAVDIEVVGRGFARLLIGITDAEALAADLRSRLHPAGSSAMS